LATAVCAAARGEGSVPGDLLGRLLAQIGRLQRQLLHPRGLTLNGMSAREIEILRLVAEGLDTAEIAAKLSYSERTVKNALHEVTTRLQLRNRSHAVAYALKQGLI
jgi:DNA-binding NarL/FixJ family response regulator